MRQEIQHWDDIKATVEILSEGDGQTGLTPTVAIQRLSDNQWLANGGGSWQAGVATNDMTEVDSTNLPGLYVYEVPAARLTYAQGLIGYRVRIVESTNLLREHVWITAARSEWEEQRDDHITSGSFGLLNQVMAGLVQGNHRLKSPTYDEEGRLESATLVCYPSGADATADTNELATFTLTCTYDAFGNLSSLLSKE